jgi:hypothetical protein
MKTQSGRGTRGEFLASFGIWFLLGSEPHSYRGRHKMSGFVVCLAEMIVQRNGKLALCEGLPIALVRDMGLSDICVLDTSIYR